MTAKLKLGRLPSTEIVKITIAVSVDLKTMLDRYARVHAEASGENNDLAIPGYAPVGMLKRFDRDRSVTFLSRDCKERSSAFFTPFQFMLRRSEGEGQYAFG